VGLACPLAAARIQKTKINILDEDRQGRYIYNCAYEVMFLTADVVLDYHQSESYIMSTTLLDKLKPEFHTNPPPKRMAFCYVWMMRRFRAITPNT